jgi:cytochrome c-type biogenesis protein CcmH/NrfF
METRYITRAWATLAVLLTVANAASEQRERITRLENALLAPCCYSEPVARHNSDVAVRMRAEITTWVSEGKSDREILDNYKKLYGLRVLGEPEGATWWWSNIVPWAVLLTGTLTAIQILRKWRRSPRPSPADTSQEIVNVPDIDDE